ncbi:MAG: 23S rRNA (uracil(1939)-C(5))-methyltransferase RlmD [Thermoleophilaceae bacterium]|nr:23S rRNA (uracil(1939)-C(5))-methyltransferase RlmD [Thermoleophilaceae bacterium]
MPEAVRPSKPQRGSEIDLHVHDLAQGGAGVARLDGYVVFVQGGFPGDRVRARIGKSKRSYAEAQMVELLEPGPDRIEARSEHPGAPWQVLPYERQLEEKERQVREALERIGGFESPPMKPIVPAVEPWRYRNKLEYSFGAGEDGQLALGFHRRGQWDAIDDIEEDVLASEKIDAIRLAVREWCRGRELKAYDRGDHSGFLRNLVVREGRRTGQIQARIVTSPGKFYPEDLAPELPVQGLLWTAAEGVAETTRGGETKLVAGKEWIEERVGDLRFRISPEAFFQTNTEMAEQLYAIAAEGAGLTGKEKVFDLFCGIGTIGLSMSGFAGHVWGLEQVEEAVRDAIRNAELNGIDNASFFAGDVRTAMRPLVEEAGKPDVIVIDPPRAGLSAKIVRRVMEAEAKRIVYVSCNPTTLAPNARQLVDDGGYELKTVTPVDMFPQTPHIEAVAVLDKVG